MKYTQKHKAAIDDISHVPPNLPINSHRTLGVQSHGRLYHHQVPVELRQPWDKASAL